ncbi:MAG: uL15 family ribosomal protein [Candidatus Pacearchaeota archaeon]|nr:uL15 family ribosomal protein [Candidatus Pacearchaeota archaeon]
MIRKRSKRSRLRGRKTAGYGCKKKHRGKGSRGGKGMAGTGKRAGQKRTFLLKYMPNYFGKKGFVSLKKLKKKEKIKTINLDELNENLEKFLNQNIAKKTEKGIEIELKNYKILSRGVVKEKLIVKADSFSAKAKEKIEAAGGSAISY